ncbi:unnamed protein product [Dibothriocephalus latus]|uniref:Sorting nexin-3 n=1 Tax=Dibothriocephalus latus TaxID=60516 RepID=A0A3P6TYQ2_DIBLA|nr:unnamed protein product [Dibothriocephalus latus]
MFAYFRHFKQGSLLPKTPVGILRKTPTSGLNNGDQVVAVKRRPGSTPKSVKIDESSLHTNALGNGGKSNGGGRIATTKVLENQIIECLRLERIDLTKPPYSDEIIVPKLPGKAWKRQLPFRADDGLFDSEFIDERRKGLESFINNVPMSISCLCTIWG